MQHVTARNMHHVTACNVHHATCNVQNATCVVHRAKCGMRHVPCDMRRWRATCDVRHARCDIRRRNRGLQVDIGTACARMLCSQLSMRRATRETRCGKTTYATQPPPHLHRDWAPDGCAQGLVRHPVADSGHERPLVEQKSLDRPRAVHDALGELGLPVTDAQPWQWQWRLGRGLSHRAAHTPAATRMVYCCTLYAQAQPTCIGRRTCLRLFRERARVRVRSCTCLRTSGRTAANNMPHVMQSMANALRKIQP